MKSKVLALVALPLLLAACAPEVESSIYIQDIAQAASTGEALSVPAILRIPQSSKEACEKGLDRLIENFKTLAPTTGKGKCIEKSNNRSTDQLAEIETEMVIATPNAAFDAQNLLLLEVKPQDETTYDLTFRLLRPIEEIVKVLATNSDELQAEFDPARFIFTLNNDSRGTIELAPNHVFVDGEPGLPELAPQTLERRKAVEIVFSDVASSYVEKANGYHFATVTVVDLAQPPATN
jgi:hypothetical protein